MSYKIIVDSCGELPERCKADPHFESVPLTLNVDGYTVVDDETFDQADFLRRVAKSPHVPKSSCPSPERYMQAYSCDAENIYGVTLSAELSGSYNSAELGKKLFHDEKGGKNIHIFNSRSASIGQTLIALKIEECEKAGMAFREVVDKVESYIEEQNTYFVLESLEALRKNGRLSNMKAIVANALNIKPVMGATPIGTIKQLDQVRGIDRAVRKMAEYVIREVKDPAEKILGIAQCNCPARALMLKEEILKRINVRDVLITETAGVSTLYASDGGVIVVI